MNEIKELTFEEIEGVVGGYGVAGIVGGVAVSFFGAYLYDAAGGYDGINEGLNTAVDTVGDFFSDAWYNDPVNQALFYGEDALF
ncbi:hypothetical protein [Gayadomonas joobiniege]|uniref:hypothetical protein n=1 Tax=Gayadomonas joobiniege TaxID=1234606 RepID=UPI000365D019|nr:hypothetical protein [Gayadomonas joobiniege]